MSVVAAPASGGAGGDGVEEAEVIILDADLLPEIPAGDLAGNQPQPGGAFPLMAATGETAGPMAVNELLTCCVPSSKFCERFAPGGKPFCRTVRRNAW
jgi:hypothetical protein